MLENRCYGSGNLSQVEKYQFCFLSGPEFCFPKLYLLIRLMLLLKNLDDKALQCS